MPFSLEARLSREFKSKKQWGRSVKGKGPALESEMLFDKGVRISMTRFNETKVDTGTTAATVGAGAGLIWDVHAAIESWHTNCHRATCSVGIQFVVNSEHNGTFIWSHCAIMPVERQCHHATMR